MMVAIVELGVNGRRKSDAIAHRNVSSGSEARRKKESQGAERNDARDGAITGTTVTAILPTTTNDQLRRPTWEFARARMRICPLLPSSLSSPPAKQSLIVAARAIRRGLTFRYISIWDVSVNDAPAFRLPPLYVLCRTSLLPLSIPMRFYRDASSVYAGTRSWIVCWKSSRMKIFWDRF